MSLRGSQSAAQLPDDAMAVETASTALAVTSGQLFWSRRGEVACALHAPAGESERWQAERWEAIPADANRHQIVYQCPHCSGHKGSIAHRKRI
jgi:hypothetical protein